MTTRETVKLFVNNCEADIGKDTKECTTGI